MGGNAGIISVRLKSERFPGKAFARIGGKTLLERVIEYTRRFGFINHLVVATEDEEVESAVKDRVDEVFMMEPGQARCGSERVYKYFLANSGFDYYIYIPADESYIDPGEMNRIWKEQVLVSTEKDLITTLYTKIRSKEELESLHTCKFLVSNHKMIYTSRAVVPCYKNKERFELESYNRHVAVMIWPQHFMQSHAKELWGDWESRYDKIEGLEQNRFIEWRPGCVQAYEIKNIPCAGVDIPEHIKIIEKKFREAGIL
jgi:3-deoxy-manno-octulosonate cytidylyltransferase (CMP-KDO synthetase)